MRINGYRRIVVIGVTGVLLAAGSLMLSGAAVASAPHATTSSCMTQDDHWPAWTNGQPAHINPKTAAGVYMWHDGNGWHIRVTHKVDNLRTFSGQLVTKGKFADVTPVRLEKGDTFSVSSDKHIVSFYFKNYGYIDGLNFKTHCAPSIKFSFQSDGSTMPAKKITIGHNGVHPAHDPFTINKVPTTTTTSTSTSTSTTTTTTLG